MSALQEEPDFIAGGGNWAIGQRYPAMRPQFHFSQLILQKVSSTSRTGFHELMICAFKREFNYNALMPCSYTW